MAMTERSEMKEVYEVPSRVSAVLAAIIPVMQLLTKRKYFPPFVFLRRDASLHTLCFPSDVEIFYLNTELSGANTTAI